LDIGVACDDNQYIQVSDLPSTNAAPVAGAGAATSTAAAASMEVAAVVAGAGGSWQQKVEVPSTGGASLSSRLRQLQQQVNVKLTELVEKERGGADTARDEEVVDADDDDDDEDGEASSPPKKRKT